MAFVVKVKPVGFTAAKFKEAIKQLIAAGAGTPKGKTYHVCYGDPNGVDIIDVWNSMEDFESFGKTLIPIMNSLGVDPGQLDVQQIHGLIIG